MFGTKSVNTELQIELFKPSISLNFLIFAALNVVFSTLIGNYLYSKLCAIPFILNSASFYQAKCQGKEHMIESEIAILSSVEHSHIIQLEEVFDFPSEKYLVMEYVQVVVNSANSLNYS